MITICVHVVCPTLICASKEVFIKAKNYGQCKCSIWISRGSRQSRWRSQPSQWSNSESERFKKVEVSGIVQFEGAVTFNCSLSADSVRGRYGDLVVQGDLSVEKSIKIYEGSLEVEGNLTAGDVEVDKKLYRITTREGEFLEALRNVRKFLQ